jgi:hypothetical protein
MRRNGLRIIATGLAALSLGACVSAGGTWVRTDGHYDPDQFNRDKYRCIQESRVGYSGGGGVYVGYGRGAAIGAGIGMAASAAIAQAAAQNAANKIGIACMEAAGYRRLSDEELQARGLAPILPEPNPAAAPQTSN